MRDQDSQKYKPFTQTINNHKIILSLKEEDLHIWMENLEALEQYQLHITLKDMQENKALGYIFDSPKHLLFVCNENYGKKFKIMVKQNGFFVFIIDFGFGEIKKKVHFQARRTEMSKQQKKIKKLQRQLTLEQKKNQSFKRNQQKDCRWSQFGKHKSYKILEDNKIEGKNMTGFKLALIEKPLSKNKKTIWRIKKVSCRKSWVAVGVCLRSIVVRNSFSINGEEGLDQLGHGCYLNSWNHQIFSHSDSILNDKQISTVEFQGINQIISMQFDPITEFLTFKNEQKIYFLPVPKNEEDDYHACLAGRAEKEGSFFQWQLIEFEEV